MIIVGQKVSHNTFGTGTIIWYGGKIQNDSTYIKVEFENKTLEFVFPTCFEKHLTALDDGFEKMISETLEAANKSKIQEQTVELSCVTIDQNFVNATPVKIDKSLPANYKNTLFFGHYYGTNSKNIYLDCCEWFGWDKIQACNFGRQGALLYAKRATPEGYSPWFVTHHNLTGTKGGEWRNTIVDDLILEEWDNYDERMWDDKTTRVVFIKINGGYYFYGLYRVDKIELKENFKYTKTYKRIKENYFN